MQFTNAILFLYDEIYKTALNLVKWQYTLNRKYKVCINEGKIK